MKKIYMILATLSALTMTAQAQNLLQGSLQVGDFDNPENLYEGSYWDVAPLNFYVAHTGAQLIYTADELGALADKDNVNITKLSFKFYNESCYDDMTRDIKVYLQQSDETAFAVVDGVKQFFTYGTTPALTTEQTWEMLDLLNDDTELVIDLANAPFALSSGKSLIVTVVADADDNSNCTSGVDEANFYTSGITGKAMTYTNNTVSFDDYALTDDFPDAKTTLGCGTNVQLPVTKIDFTYTETATGINEVQAETAGDATYYNLMGQKFSGANLPAGIYLHGGKKVIVK